MLTDLSRVALVVDDEPFARLFAAQILLDQGYVVLEAEHAAEAVELLRDNEDLSLVMTDIAMPGAMSGVGLAAHIQLVRPDLALIVVSGYTAPAYLGDPQRVQFLAKPYTTTALVAAVCELTARPSPSGDPIPQTMFAP